MNEECVILDIPELHLNLFGLKVDTEEIKITADPAGLLGGLLAGLTCGGGGGGLNLDAIRALIEQVIAILQQILAALGGGTAAKK